MALCRLLNVTEFYGFRRSMPSDATLDFTNELWRVPVVLFLSNEDVERALSWSDVVRVCEDLLLERARGTAWFSPRQRYVLPTDSRMMILPGGLEGKSVMGTRIYSMHSRTSPDSKKFLAEDVLDAHALNVVYEMQSAEMLTITAGDADQHAESGRRIGSGGQVPCKWRFEDPGRVRERQARTRLSDGAEGNPRN